MAKAGRTHLMDAVPVTLGQEFSGFAAQIELAGERISATLPRVAAVPLGGTAVGTGLNSHPRFAELVRSSLRARTGIVVTAPPRPVRGAGLRDALVELSGALKTVAVSLTKIATDLAWMSSGPERPRRDRPAPLQKGSSIMPGKVNPVLPEVVCQVAAQVIGNDTAITIGAMQGNFQLNVRCR
ncbi:MAG: lyase family protein [Acidimicrobiales bacterium]